MTTEPDNRTAVANEFSGQAQTVVQAGRIEHVHFHLANPPAGLGGAPRTIADWNPFDLGVHHSLAVRSPGEDLPELPRYFRRGHDDELDGALPDPPRSVAIVVVGSSSTGKTRTLYEAVRRYAAVRRWPLNYPQDARSLDQAFDAGLVAPRTVLWLNETQEHLSGLHGESAAAGLRALLNGSIAGPVIVLGTLWPEHWDELTAEPRGGRDPHHHARQLLLHQVRRIRVPGRFTAAEIGGLDGGTADPRLLSAAEGSVSTRQVIQTLAGGPLLVDRYEHPHTATDRYATAVIAAALHARQLGHHNPLPHKLLRDAAPAYLSEDDHIDLPAGWFTMGLARALNDTVHGVTAFLPRRTRPGPGPADAYELHDYLTQHGAHDGNAPARTWEALISHARTPDDLLRAANRAAGELRYHYAERLHRAAIDAGATRPPDELKEMVLKRAQLEQLRSLVAAGTTPARLDQVFYERVIDRLGTLPPRQRAAFVLRYMESLSVHEIAATLGTAPATSRRHINAALAALRTELAAATNP
ncbi:sigma factor-like helix-turn-helix DNA-binding protein [Amycolatopsis sp.]|uniref:sigma factor-like helix-turn-helix DNA-binding protein n=1 Tax=Amycolatopsis sp. TaxID=37632 RepID=UPI002CF6EFD1|nr:sigma factor-like helix-turn-helix DNA-binding protein [Amycolatopsis sp.]HVV12165.1 sigma factor-like helix-turn-helix DNA-binding protein [Amycolatopsis sp.]